MAGKVLNENIPITCIMCDSRKSWMVNYCIKLDIQWNMEFQTGKIKDKPAGCFSNNLQMNEN